jgi:hypothetical protein
MLGSATDSLAKSRSVEFFGDELSVPGQQRIRLRDSRQFFQGFPSEPLGDLSQCRLFTFGKQQSTLDLTSPDTVLCRQILIPQQEFLIDRSGEVGHHPRPKHFGFPLDLQPSESEIVDAAFQSEKSIRSEPVESCKLRYFNSFEFFDHTRSLKSRYTSSKPTIP